MTTETESNRRGSFVTAIWPWVLGAGMLAVYVATLQHYAGPASLDRLAGLSGWNWRPQAFGPVTFLVTYPLRWLPPGAMTVGMNLFSAVCAALALVLLARSVALLPHDRTNEQRQREQSETSILSIRSAWLPPLFAVLVCGLQLTFWENAIEFRQLSIVDGGEMLNLLMFAWLVRCVLEYRFSGRDSWLNRLALVLGLAIANDWFMIILFPGFVAALVWSKGFEFFNWRFLLRTLLWGLAGLSLILLFPLVHGISLSPHFYIFKYTLHFTLSTDKSWALGFFHLKASLLVLAVCSVLPVLLLCIRWASSFGDSTPIGVFLATSAFNVVHVFFLLCCVWSALDSPFGPRKWLEDTPFAGVPFLSLYYLGALSIGYFSGYFLLVFGARPAKPRQRPQPLVRWFNRGVTAAVWLLAAAVTLVLVVRNLRSIEDGKSATAAVERYFTRTAKALPPAGGVLMSDDTFILHGVQMALVREGNKADYLPVDTSALIQTRSYFDFLAKKHPEFDLANVLTNLVPGQALDDLDCLILVGQLAAKHAVYYLHPSYGYYFERYYARPHGLVYELLPCATNSWQTPPPSPAELAENRAFWQDAGEDLTNLVRAMKPPAWNVNPNLWEQFQQAAHLAVETNRLAAVLGRYYSRALNSWGVELATAGQPVDAGKCYGLAAKLNPANASAHINLEFNQGRLAGEKPVLKPPKAFEAEMGDYRQWFLVISGGPVDEPNFCGGMGMLYLARNNYRQAIQMLERERDLMPDDLAPLMQLSQAYLSIQSNPNALSYMYPSALQTGSNALAVAEAAIRLAPNNPAALTSQAVALLQLGQFQQALAPLDTLLAMDGTNVQMHYFRGFANKESGRLGEAKKDFEFVIQALPQAFQVYYNLGEITDQQKDSDSAIKYYELFLEKAPPSLTNSASPDVKRVYTRLEELRAIH